MAYATLCPAQSTSCAVLVTCRRAPLCLRMSMFHQIFHRRSITATDPIMRRAQGEPGAISGVLNSALARYYIQGWIWWAHRSIGATWMSVLVHRNSIGEESTQPARLLVAALYTCLKATRKCSARGPKPQHRVFGPG